MANRGELTSYVLHRLGVSSSRTAFADGVRAQLYRRYLAACARFELGRDIGTLVFVADDPFVDLPDDWLKTRTIRLSSGAGMLREITEEVMAAARGTAASTTATASAGPTRYTFMPPARILLDVAPTENDSDGAEIVYVVKPTVWTTDADAPDLLPEQFHDLLAEETIVRFAADQEEFATHAAAAQQNAAVVTAELQEYLNERTGDSSAHITRMVYG